MPDAAGYRIKFGVIVPSTNTVVEADYNRMAPPGVTFHTGRMYIEQPLMDSDANFEALLAQIRGSIRVAIRDVMTCKPDSLVMGMSSETFWGGVEGNAQFIERVRVQAGLNVSTGASACRAALERYGAKRIAVLSPYQPVADRQVTRYFEEAGFEVVGFKGLRCPTATAIADVPEALLLPIIRDELNGPGVEAIVQIGTNLSMVRLADEAERWLGKPVLAINAATLWHALRTNGIPDQMRGFGSLLREH
jgi:maleate isomerase